MTTAAAVKNNDFLKETPAPDGSPDVKILVLDGGGLRGVMSLEILAHLERAVRKEANDQSLRLGEVFDMIVGTSTGGLIALGLGKKKMDCERIRQLYKKVAEEVFTENRVAEAFWGAVSYTGVAEQFSTQTLEKIMKEEFHEDDIDDKKGPHLNMMEPQKINGDDNPRYKDWKKEPFVSVMSSLVNNYLNPVPVLIRNYDITSGQGFNEFGINNFDLSGISSMKVWEAARCTTAAPTYFKPKLIDPPPLLIPRVRDRKLCDIMNFPIPIGSRSPDENDIINDLRTKIEEMMHYTSKKHQFGDIIKHMNEKRKKSIYSKKITFDSFGEKIIKYWNLPKLEFTDGGMNSNAPCLFAYTEARRLWPNSNIKMLAVGTSKPPVSGVYDKIPRPKTYLSKLFEEMFRGKELTTLVPLMSFAQQSKSKFALSRWNPEFDPTKTEMSDERLMPQWKNAGKAFAERKTEEIDRWAKYLVGQRGNNNSNRETLVNLFEDKQKSRSIRSKL